MSAPLEGSSETAAPVEVSSSPVETTSTEPSLNPAWKGVTDSIPAEFIPKITPVLQQWDRNYQELATKHAQYADFQDVNQLRAYKELADMINNDPRAIYDRLGELLKITPQQAQQVVAQQAATQASQEPAQTDEELDPAVRALTDRQKAMEAQQQQLLSYVEKEELERATATFSQQIDTKVAAIRQADPNVDIPELFRRIEGNFTKTGQLDVDGSYQEMKSYEDRIASRFQGNRQNAPMVVNPAGGGMPPTDIVDPSKLSQKDRGELFHNKYVWAMSQST